MTARKKMDEGDLHALLSAEITDAANFIDEDIAPERLKAVKAFFGKLVEPEQGRSTATTRETHDTIMAVMPSLMRIFFGPEHVVSFEPRGAEDVEEAEQKTDYCNYIVTNDNEGFEIFYAAIKNALREKVGIVKSWWDDSAEVSTRTYSGLDEMGLTALLEDLNKATKAELVEASEDENGLRVRIKLTKPVDRVRIAALPPEEFLISRNASDIDSAAFKGHRTVKTVSDLVAMGFDRDEIEACAGEDLDFNEERLQRSPSHDNAHISIDPTMRPVLYVEGYVRADMDGDGIAELIRVHTIGSGYKIVDFEPVDDHPFSDFHADIEPHTFFCESVADKTADIDETQTKLLRAGFDGLAQSLFPRTVVGSNGYMEDALNTEVGAILRSKSDPASAYYFQSAPNTAQHALPWLTVMDEMREKRTGVSKVSMGLDAQALQNTTATAAEGNFTRSQERIELMARVMASGMRKLFRRIATLVTENQRAERMIQLRNKWVPIDPRAWRSEMNVICNVGLGGGSQAQRVSILSMIAAKQEAIMMQAGIDNPLVGPVEYRNTLAKLVEESGLKNPDAFFRDPNSEEVKAEMAAKAQEPPAPDPKLLEAQARLQFEQQKVELQAQQAAQKAAHDLQVMREKMQLEMQAQADKQRAEFEFRMEQARAEIQLKREEMQMEFQLKAQANQLNAAAKVEAAAQTNLSGPELGGDVG